MLVNKEKEISSLNEAALGSTPRRSFEDRLQYLLADEEQILNFISARAPLPRILNAICCSLDCQIGNMVSLISLGAGKNTLDEISRHAKLFGLHVFFSAGIETGSGDGVGFLEMYCCIQRRPSLDEKQLIERAVTLAAIAIKHYNESGKKKDFLLHAPLARTFEPSPPTSVN
jgi:hypothetical protein